MTTPRQLKFFGHVLKRFKSLGTYGYRGLCESVQGHHHVSVRFNQAWEHPHNGREHSAEWVAQFGSLRGRGATPREAVRSLERVTLQLATELQTVVAGAPKVNDPDRLRKAMS